MRRFLSVWLVWIVVAVFSVALALAYYPLTYNAEAEAEADLQLLISAAFTRMDIAERSVSELQRSTDETVLSKARAIARFLAHDDTLLATDALVVLCDLLDVQSIDVTDRDGKVVASSDAAELERAIIDEDTFAWAATVLSDGGELTEPDGTEEAVLYGCVARTDTDGVVLVKAVDAALQTAIESAKPANVLNSMAFIRDDLMIADTPGTDGAYSMDGYFCLRQSRGDVSVVAMRLLSTIYVVRNAVMLMIAVCMLISILAATVVQLCIPATGRSKRSRISMHHVPADLPELEEPDESELARLIAEEAAEPPVDSAEAAEYAAMSEAYGDIPMPDDASAAEEELPAPDDAAQADPPPKKPRKKRAPRRKNPAPQPEPPQDETPASDDGAKDGGASPDGTDDGASGFDKVF